MSSQNSKFDDAKAESFANNLIDTLNKASLSLMISIGHRTGLFDKMSEMEPATSDEIAKKTNLNERYIREWLGAMVTSGIIDVDPPSMKYYLPKEHSAFLTRKASADNIGAFTQYISVLGSIEDDILKCFKEGGGVPYSKYKRFHEVMAEDSGQSVLSSFEVHILPLVDGIENRLREGINVLDAGCGSGHIINKLAELFPASTFTGMDLSGDAISTARKLADSKGLKNVKFEIADLTEFHETAPEKEYDFIATFDAIHDQAKPLNVLKGINRALKDDGDYLMQDISASSYVYKNKEHPIGTFLYTISCMHCMSVSLAQNGEGLGAMWGEEKTLEYLKKAGFNSVKTHKLTHDIQNNWYVIRK